MSHRSSKKHLHNQQKTSKLEEEEQEERESRYNLACE